MNTDKNSYNEETYDKYNIPDYNKIDYENDDKAVQKAKIKVINEQITSENKKD